MQILSYLISRKEERQTQRETLSRDRKEGIASRVSRMNYSQDDEDNEMDTTPLIAYLVNGSDEHMFSLG